MLTRPPPAPRTRTTGRAPRGAQVRPFGGLRPWPASSSKQSQAPRSRAVLLYRATPAPSTPRPPRRRARAPGGQVPGRTSRAGASASTPLGRVADVKQPPDQRLDPAQGPPLVVSEPVGQRAFPQLQLEPGPLPRAQLLPRHRPLRPERPRPAVPPGLVPAPHRSRRDPQVVRDLIDRVAPGEPPGGLHPQQFPPLLLGGRVPAPLRIPHTPVIRPQPADVTTYALRINPG